MDFVIVMIGTALAAAVLYGAGAAMEQRQAAAAPQSSAGRPRLLFHLARQPLWLLGIAVQIGGFAAHAVALGSGSRRPCSCWSRPSRRRGGHRAHLVGPSAQPPSGAAALTVVAAIATFLALTSSVTVTPRPAGPRRGGGPGRHGHGGAALAAAAVGLRAAGRRRAVLLARGGGLADSCSAIVTLAFSHVAGHGAGRPATSWTVYALVVGGAGTVPLTQTAYQTGRPMLTLPIIAAVTPVASVAVGIGLLGETPGSAWPARSRPPSPSLVTSLALARLAHSAPHPEVPGAEVAPSGVSRPDVSRPGVPRPGVPRPGVPRPGVPRHDVPRPDVSHPEPACV